MIELKVINKNDPLKRRVEKQTEQEEFSPMDPPDAYSPPNIDTVDYKDMHPFLQQLVNEHKSCEIFSGFTDTKCVPIQMIIGVCSWIIDQSLELGVQNPGY